MKELKQQVDHTKTTIPWALQSGCFALRSEPFMRQCFLYLSSFLMTPLCNSMVQQWKTGKYRCACQASISSMNQWQKVINIWLCGSWWEAQVGETQAPYLAVERIGYINELIFKNTDHCWMLAASLFCWKLTLNPMERANLWIISFKTCSSDGHASMINSSVSLTYWTTGKL